MDFAKNQKEKKMLMKGIALARHNLNQCIFDAIEEVKPDLDNLYSYWQHKPMHVYLEMIPTEVNKTYSQVSVYRTAVDKAKT